MWVTNNSEHDLIDGFNGKTYVFCQGRSVDVPLEVCQHIFGFGFDRKEPFLQRLGWMIHSKDYEKALDRLNSFSFTSEKPTPNVHVLSPVVDSKPVPVPKRRAGNVQKAA